MKLTDIGAVIAERRLTLTRPAGEVVVEIGRPAEFAEGGSFYCPFRIAGLSRSGIKYAGGVDAVQALELALKIIGAILYTSDEFKAGRLFWLGEDDGDLGFPHPNWPVEPVT